MEPGLKESIDRLSRNVHQLIIRWSPWRHFINGIMTGIGATVGAAIIVALLAWLLHQLGNIDLFRPAVDQVLPYVERKIEPIEDRLPAPTYEEAIPSPSPSPKLTPSPEE